MFHYGPRLFTLIISYIYIQRLLYATELATRHISRYADARLARCCRADAGYIMSYDASWDDVMRWCCRCAAVTTINDSLCRHYASQYCFMRHLAFLSQTPNFYYFHYIIMLKITKQLYADELDASRCWFSCDYLCWYTRFSWCNACL